MWKHFLNWEEKYHHLMMNSQNLISYHPNSKHIENIMEKMEEGGGGGRGGMFQDRPLNIFPSGPT